jgi:gluconokinase
MLRKWSAGILPALIRSGTLIVTLLTGSFDSKGNKSDDTKYGATEINKPFSSMIIVMGVAGSGKTTVGKLLAEKLNWKFADADEFHPAANLQKMSDGVALTDLDREPWLETLREAISGWMLAGDHTVLACSALKKSYRHKLQIKDDMCVVYLKGTFEMFSERLRSRKGHFMKSKMLQSQFIALEEPDDAITIDAGATPECIVEEICEKLNCN